MRQGTRVRPADGSACVALLPDRARQRMVGTTLASRFTAPVEWSTVRRPNLIAATPLRCGLIRQLFNKGDIQAARRRPAITRSRAVLAMRDPRPAPQRTAVAAVVAADRTRAAADIPAVEAITARIRAARFAAQDFSSSSLRPGQAPPSEFGPSFFGNVLPGGAEVEKPRVTLHRCRCWNARPKGAPSIAGIPRTAGRLAGCPNPAPPPGERVPGRGTR